MATLLHHIQTRMQMSIAEAEEIWRHTERKIAEFHQCLDAFELWFLAWPSPSIDVSTLQVAVEILRVDLDIILEARVLECEAPSAEPAC